MKDHIIAAVVNDLRDTAIKFHDTQQLRERLRHCIEPLLSCDTPQVVADEPKAASWLCTDLDGHGDVGFTKEIAKQRAGHSCNYFYPLFDTSAPVQAQEPVAYMIRENRMNNPPTESCTVPNNGWSEWEPTSKKHGDAALENGYWFQEVKPLFLAPVQPVAVPDTSSAPDDQMCLQNWLDNACYLLDNTPGAVRHRPGAGDENLLCSLIANYIALRDRKAAAPAAQGDDSFMPEKMSEEMREAMWDAITRHGSANLEYWIEDLYNDIRNAAIAAKAAS